MTHMNVLVSIQQPVRAWQIPAECVDALRDRFPDITWMHATDPEARARGLADCDVAFTWILSAAELAAAPRLRWLHTSAVAVETLALPDLFARGVIVSNTRGVQSASIAEHVMAVLLALAKQLPFVLETQRDRRWAQNEFLGDRLPWLLKGRTLGLIGIGTIGAEIAQPRRGLRHERHRPAAAARRRRHSRRERDPSLEPLDTLLERADVLVIAAPLTPETMQMIGAPQLARMKRGSVLINVGRARIIDHVALGEACTVRPSRRRVAGRLSSGAVAARRPVVDAAKRRPDAAHLGVPAGPLERSDRLVCRESAALSARRRRPLPSGARIGLLNNSAWGAWVPSASEGEGLQVHEASGEAIGPHPIGTRSGQSTLRTSYRAP